jgi:hypothetical protein
VRSFSEFDASLGMPDVAQADQDRLRSLAAWAYLLLRPGMEFVRQRSNFILGWQAAVQAGAAVSSGTSAGAVGAAGVPPLGSWMILPNLTTPATRTVLPSHDALYGAAHLELDLLGPVVVTVPPNIDDRYFSVAVMDAHMNNVAHIGPRWTGNDGGDHLIVPPGYSGVTPGGLPVIEASTTSICLYNRMLVEPVAGDIDRVRAWQAGLRLTQLAHWGEAHPVLDDVPTQAFVHPDINTMTDAVEYLRIGLDHLLRNPMVREASWLEAMVRGAGLVAAGDDPDLRAAVEAGVDEATRMLDATLTTWPRVDGWMVPDDRLGLPNPEVLKAAAFQQFQIGSNDSSESVYYFVDTDPDGAALDASGGARYELAFPPGGRPPHHGTGYWSVTMYGRDSLLVDNPIDRYALRPGSPGFQPRPDGTLVVTMSTALPDGVAEGTWLPAPAGPFRLGLRLYYPKDQARTGAWMPPGIRRALT